MANKYKADQEKQRKDLEKFAEVSQAKDKHCLLKPGWNFLLAKLDREGSVGSSKLSSDTDHKPGDDQVGIPCKHCSDLDFQKVQNRCLTYDLCLI